MRSCIKDSSVPIAANVLSLLEFVPCRGIACLRGVVMVRPMPQETQRSTRIVSFFTTNRYPNRPGQDSGPPAKQSVNEHGFVKIVYL